MYGIFDFKRLKFCATFEFGMWITTMGSKNRIEPNTSILIKNTYVISERLDWIEFENKKRQNLHSIELSIS